MEDRIIRKAPTVMILSSMILSGLRIEGLWRNIFQGRSEARINAETQRTAEKRREKELSANLCESLRLSVESSQAASKFTYYSIVAWKWPQTVKVGRAAVYHFVSTSSFLTTFSCLKFSCLFFPFGCTAIVEPVRKARGFLTEDYTDCTDFSYPWHPRNPRLTAGLSLCATDV